MENIEAFKKEHNDLLLRHSLKDVVILSGKFGYETEYSIMQMRNYLYDIKHVIEQKMDYSIISHLTYNLNLQLLLNYNRANEYYEASRYYLIGHPGLDIHKLISDYQEKSKEIRTQINNFEEISLFRIYCAHPADFLASYHYKKGINGKSEPLINLERELSFMNGVQLLKCLLYLMDLTEQKMLDIRNGITYESNEFIEIVYDLNYVFYADNYWGEKREKFRNHVENDELVEGLTTNSLKDYYKQILNDFKTNPVGRLWDENVGNKSELAYELKILPLMPEQWEYYFKNIFKLDEIKRWINELKHPNKTLKVKKISKQAGDSLKPRETMTFQKKSSVLDGHLTLLFNNLTKEGWISGNEADFKALFSGKRDADCVITWLDKYGRGTLFNLFKAFDQEGLIIIPEGFGISTILEGHFKDSKGEWLNGLAKGNRPHAAALPVIAECVKLLQIDAHRLAYGNNQDDEDFQAKFDPFDHQDLQMHKR